VYQIRQDIDSAAIATDKWQWQKRGVKYTWRLTTAARSSK